MYIKRTVTMARNRPPTCYTQGDMGAELVDIKEYDDGTFQLWKFGYCTGYPIGPKTSDLDTVQSLFIANVAEMTRRHAGGVWVYDAVDMATYRKALWADS